MTTTAPGLETLERAFLRMCFDETPREADLQTLHGAPERWLMYRSMVRSRLYEMLRLGLPKTAALLGPARFDREASRYLEAHGPRSRFIREIVHELVAFVSPTWSTDASLPPYLLDLARYEATKWRVSSLEWREAPARELDFEAPALINPTVVTLELWHRVDKLKRDGDPAPPRLEQRHLGVVYRRPGSSRISTYVLNDIGGRLFEAWQRPQSQADGVRAVLADLGRQADAGFVDSMAGVLADLVEHEVILGSPSEAA